ncbi:MAG: hypothetical protein RLZZ338_601 [Cyanobacteriota bacterium]|jgi:hypothetical protein
MLMPTAGYAYAFIEPGKIELGVKKEELELVAPLEEGHQQMLVRKQRNKLFMMKELEMQLRENLDKVKEDLA